MRKLGKAVIWFWLLVFLALPTSKTVSADMAVPFRGEDPAPLVPAPTVFSKPTNQGVTQNLVMYVPTPVPIFKTSSGVAMVVAGSITLIAGIAIIYIMLKNP